MPMKLIKFIFVIFACLTSLLLLIWNRLRYHPSIILPNKESTIFASAIVFLFICLYITKDLVSIHQYKWWFNFIQKIKNNFSEILINIHFIKLLEKSFDYLIKHVILSQILLYIIYTIRLFVLFLFIIDVFYFNYLDLFFKAFPLLIIPLLINVYYLNLSLYNKLDWKFIEPKIQIGSPENNTEFVGVINLETYLNLNAKIQIDNLPKVNFIILLTPEFIEEIMRINPTKSINYKKTIAKYKILLERLTTRHTVIYTFMYKNFKHKIYLDKIIYLLYFLGYVYIIYMYDPSSFCIIGFKLIKYVEEPFSGLFI
jgi:hypothetical protein